MINLIESVYSNLYIRWLLVIRLACVIATSDICQYSPRLSKPTVCLKRTFSWAVVSNRLAWGVERRKSWWWQSSRLCLRSCAIVRWRRKTSRRRWQRFCRTWWGIWPGFGKLASHLHRWWRTRRVWYMWKDPVRSCASCHLLLSRSSSRLCKSSQSSGRRKPWPCRRSRATWIYSVGRSEGRDSHQCPLPLDSASSA